ncbi:dinuclear metal center protein, YbgI/SA1388 family [Nocardioides scoriae]|uniref:GTP cyclohydrolase 1 type 2 homolog n=1 Tax=Nocardioides scoriae TaxID=642780 RepID=A0A1H1M897_9ACTN|nr:Nif3-like dinuclear metal center hexameric protein [Nocardioides scoriae]SDR83031.1 dinuclear metal center protein, YbgI/SA1388 family [Nocardioides scoriae]
MTEPAPTLGEVAAQLDAWYPPHHADSWDAVGLVCGDPAEPVRRVLLAVDPVLAVAEEAVARDVQLVLTHHPLLLSGVHGVAATDPKGRVVHRLVRAGCGLMAAHTNADSPVGGVSESLALAIGLTDVRPLEAEPDDPTRGSGRLGRLPEPVSLRAFAEHVARVLPATAHGVRVAGDPDRVVSRVGLCGGAGDFLLDRAREEGVDVYLTSDLRHHPASELREHDAPGGAGAPALVDVAHWAAESTWLPVIRERLLERWGDTVEVLLSEVRTDPWTFRAAEPADEPIVDPQETHR